ncbi:MAG: phosphate/phosphite/phosphonate ABC transporter substrate-binding protein [Sulfurimonadaceae bacterium]
MMKIIVPLFLCIVSLWANENTLHVGYLSTENSEILQQKLSPFVAYLEAKTGLKVHLSAGYDYQDAIDKIADETFDIAFLGPVPYIKAKEKNPALEIVATLNNAHSEDFESVIFVKKDSPLTSLQELKGKTFAFGSKYSTLSYYVPMFLLKQEHVDTALKRFDFLGRHDRVAQYVIMGKYDAGSIKNSVARKYAPYIRVIKRSKQYENFLFVASSHLDRGLLEKIRHAILSLEAKEILQGFDNKASGFTLKEDKDYDALRKLVHEVESLQR